MAPNKINCLAKEAKVIYSYHQLIQIIIKNFKVAVDAELLKAWQSIKQYIKNGIQKYKGLLKTQNSEKLLKGSKKIDKSQKTNQIGMTKEKEEGKSNYMTKKLIIINERIYYVC